MDHLDFFIATAFPNMGDANFNRLMRIMLMRISNSVEIAPSFFPPEQFNVRWTAAKDFLMSAAATLFNLKRLTDPKTKKQVESARAAAKFIPKKGEGGLYKIAEHSIYYDETLPIEDQAKKIRRLDGNFSAEENRRQLIAFLACAARCFDLKFEKRFVFCALVAEIITDVTGREISGKTIEETVRKNPELAEVVSHIF